MPKSALPLLFFVLTIGLQPVLAQFGNFFENMWGHQQQQQQQQRSGASQWAAYADSVSCSQYMCPETLDCVAKPSQCPCPNAEDIKCIIPDSEGGAEDATVICTRGQNECAEVERLMRKGSKSKKT
ncbi:hypothetical protein D9613_005128 [Agrocybe pediades]|uniref:Long chronological lifespan protein 2 n=1 Tax=Agrocybe pediades TaxID=84607 RepID=A0A8H4R0L1_9AGAR|nr:hypothetical protein D9613_005128 [Agrocybe pediades]KAF9568957.1 hypothetical protein CPC08DRAFT_678535 [Agrocybe pediades]